MKFLGGLVDGFFVLFLPNVRNSDTNVLETG